MQLSPARLLAFVSLLGMVYAGYMWTDERRGRYTRAGACQANLNLIDRYVALWERMHLDLDASHGMLSIDFDTDGSVARSSGVPGTLGPGSQAVPLLALDTEAFICPGERTRDSGGRAVVHYRWVMSADPLAALDGGTRGAVCLVHGETRPPADRPAWHALVKGRRP